MHILLTDVLTCPRCGPGHGLIVLADRMEDRRVAEGSLGCANCREEYRIRSGVADLRYPPGSGAGRAPAAEPTEDAALRIAALLGAKERPGMLLLLGLSPRTAAEVARLLPASHVVAAWTGEGEGGAEGISRVRIGAVLPFRDRSLRGVAMDGRFAPELLEEALRTLAPGGRLVLDPAPSGAAEALPGRGVDVLLEQDGVVVASPSPAG